MKGKVALHNLGCKVNAYETEAMQQMLEAAGYEIVPFEPGADIYVINTCSVTNIADPQVETNASQSKKDESGCHRGRSRMLCAGRYKKSRGRCVYRYHNRE